MNIIIIMTNQFWELNSKKNKPYTMLNKSEILMALLVYSDWFTLELKTHMQFYHVTYHQRFLKLNSNSFSKSVLCLMSGEDLELTCIEKR